MDKKKLIIIITVIIILTIGILFYLLLQPKKNDEIVQNEIPNFPNTPQTEQEYYPDAPKPNLDPEEVFKLWPDLQNPQTVNKEEIEKQWLDFARKYPDNFYIPSKYLNLSEEQLKERQKTLETFTALESKYASLKVKLNKNAKPGVDGPDVPEKPTINPEEQRIYFTYKIKELQSRIELIEYWLKNQSENIDSQQKELAQQDLKQWKKELEEYQKLLKEIPEQ